MDTDIVQTELVQKTKPQLFVKGKSGNPLGRGKGNLSMSTKIKIALNQIVVGEKTTLGDEIITSLTRQAKMGDLKAIEMVLDRVDGKPTQTNQNLNININDPLKPEQQERLLKILDQ